MSLRTASFNATYTFAVEENFTKVDVDTHKVSVAEDPLDYLAVSHGYYSWDFGTINSVYSTLVEEVGGATITNIRMEFNYNLADDGIDIEVLQYNNSDPRLSSAAEVNDISSSISVVLGTADIVTNGKYRVTINLTDTNSFYYDSQVAIAALNNVTLSITRKNNTSAGSFEISGLNLVGGSSEWRVAVSGEPTDPPLLIITYDIDEESHPTLNMKYTTSDPTTIQSTGSNSIGGYWAQNDVFPSASIGASINSTQTTVPIDASFSLPSKIGLASVGPEIFKYTTIDTANHRLAGITRAVVPGIAFPAGFDSFRIAEKVHYLHSDDNDLNKLFDTRPSGSLIQYRCVAISNSDTEDNFSIQDAYVSVVQHPDSDVQVRIGVEHPRYDSRTGITEDATTETSTTVIVDASFTEADGFFNGALIKLLNPTEYVLVSTFSSGVFILQSTVVGLDAGRSFVIMPTPSQTIINDATSPTSNSGRFSGFSEDEEAIPISLVEHGNTMQENDLFYVWIRRVAASNVKSSDNTGAILIFRYRNV